MREEKFTILKAIAIILVVLSHAGACGWINQTIYIFHVPIFFFCAGYFFNTAYLNDERTYVVHRIKGLYFPFVRWSIFFLLIHNLLFYTGLLNETYGNSAGGVPHPFGWHQFCQHLWNIVFNMSGYDTFLCGAFWFFRAFLLSSIAFLLLFKLVLKVSGALNEKQTGWVVLALSLLFMTWKTLEGLQITGVAQGGAREITGLALMSMGFLTRRYDVVSRLNWRFVTPFLAFLILAAVLFPSAMYWRPTFAQFVSLPLPAYCGFIVCLYIAMLIDGHTRRLRQILLYIGSRTLYVFAFHLVAFKLVSAAKVAWYDLPWLAVGGHPYVMQPSNNVVWVLLYCIVGVGLPLLWLEVYRKLSARYNLTGRKLLGYLLIGLYLMVRLICILLRKLYVILRNLLRQFRTMLKDALAASSVKDDE